MRQNASRCAAKKRYRTALSARSACRAAISRPAIAADSTVILVEGKAPARRHARPGQATSERREQWRVGSVANSWVSPSAGRLRRRGARAGLGAGRSRAAGAACPVCGRHGPEGGRAARRSRRSRRPTRRLPSLFSRTELRSIRFDPARSGIARSGADDKVGFSLEPLHRGFIFTPPIDIYIVENGALQRVIYEAADFDFGKLQPPADMADIGFSGISHPDGDGPGLPGRRDFPGRELFRARARRPEFRRHRARPCRSAPAISPARNFRCFAHCGSRKPAPATNTLTIHALLDSASMTGAFRFTFRPGEATIIDTEMTLIARVAIDKFGVGAMAAAYLFGGLDHRRPDDCARRRLRSNRPANALREGRVALAPGRQSRNLANLSFRRPQPARLRSLAARRGPSTLFMTTKPLGTAPLALDRTDRRLGRRRGAAARNPGGVREQRQHHRAVAAEGGLAAGASQVASPIASSGAGRRRRGRRSPVCTSSASGKMGKPPALHGRIVPATLFADPQKAASATAEIHTPSPGQIASLRSVPI